MGYVKPKLINSIRNLQVLHFNILYIHDFTRENFPFVTSNGEKVMSETQSKERQHD